ncbi:shikimate kinase [Ramlibacter sp. H39-3-26]|uniref:shikimate kinase n=1 Tax=Curvibacter soli TaxID=3031331 RepID=UPI0023DAE483|nr:shikimate kinase [Ramlibacter sp. H39-3-26]MDF1483766.1 shikimate kinase [Ramlibacter sp. H39-3-26]
MIVSLVGLPGSGKTTIGRQLARRLGWPFVDSDHVIEQRIGCSIREYFARNGESAFRDIEEQVIDELTAGSDGVGVLATGGGVVLRPANRQRLRERSRVFYLHSTPEDIFRRLRHDASRPLLQGDDPLERLRQLQEERDPLYAEVAHFTFETGRPTVNILLGKILMQLELSDSGSHKFDTS